jgi:hypothetical protein
MEQMLTDAYRLVEISRDEPDAIGLREDVTALRNDLLRVNPTALSPIDQARIAQQMLELEAELSRLKDKYEKKQEQGGAPKGGGGEKEESGSCGGSEGGGKSSSGASSATEHVTKRNPEFR